MSSLAKVLQESFPRYNKWRPACSIRAPLQSIDDARFTMAKTMLTLLCLVIQTLDSILVAHEPHERHQQAISIALASPRPSLTAPKQ